MASPNNRVSRLRAQIASLEGLLSDLKTQLTDAEAYYNRTAPAQIDTKLRQLNQKVSNTPVRPVTYNEKSFESLVDHLELSNEEQWRCSWELTPEEYKRYGRQLILPEVGLRGGLSFLKYSLRLSLTPLGGRTATTEKCIRPNRRCWRARMPSCHISCGCRGGRDRSHGW